RLTFNSTVIGFILLTLAIVIGGIWLPEAFPNFSYLDPKLVSTLLVWLIFGYGIFGKLFLNWYGKKIVYFSLIGFLIAMISLIITTTMKESFHSFY
ncbi:MAG: cytochrome c biogenesis protein, partial [Melioribacteraceae bacterium]|nr:cytochrome c biogenesis protein [Melioribacteraceae bacterium]